jgi:HAE1 family hydrophobic/amphiphilic exporter-1
MSLSSASIHRPITTYICCLVALLLGGIAFERLPVDLMPEVEYPTLSVRCLSTKPNQSAILSYSR